MTAASRGGQRGIALASGAWHACPYTAIWLFSDHLVTCATHVRLRKAAVSRRRRASKAFATAWRGRSLARPLAACAITKHMSGIKTADAVRFQDPAVRADTRGGSPHLTSPHLA